MKPKEPITHRIFIPSKDGELVNIQTLSEQERQRIGNIAFTRLADSLMWSQGYEREQTQNEEEDDEILLINNNKGA